MLPTLIANHLEQAIDRKIEHFSGDKPVLDGVIGAHVDELQDLENEVWNVIQGRTLQAYAPGQTISAQGVQLDILGKIVGCDRSGRDDDHYIQGIRLQVLVNSSFGSFEDLLQLVRFAIGATGTIDDYEKQYHHAAYFRCLQLPEPVAAELGAALQDATAAGYRTLLEYTEAATTDDQLLFGAYTDASGNALYSSGQNTMGWTGDDSLGGLTDAIVG